MLLIDVKRLHSLFFFLLLAITFFPQRSKVQPSTRGMPRARRDFPIFRSFPFIRRSAARSAAQRSPISKCCGQASLSGFISVRFKWAKYDNKHKQLERGGDGVAYLRSVSTLKKIAPASYKWAHLSTLCIPSRQQFCVFLVLVTHALAHLSPLQ
jgi:hypothetical protein